MTIETPAQVDDRAETPDPSRIIGYEFVDPHTLLIEENVRAGFGDISDLDQDFVASIADHGVTQPIVVRRRASDDRLVVRTGKGRTRAARHVGRWVDVVIERDPAPETDDVREEQIERIVAQLAENQHRTGITDADEVRAHGQLMLMWEMSPEEIASATHSDPDRVRRTTRVAASATAMDMLTQLDLGHLEVIAELDGDDAAVAELINVALHNPNQFAHVAQRLRQARELTDVRAAKAQELADSGVRVVDPSEYAEAMELHKLRARAEDPAYSPTITDEEHADCPGHAVSVEVWRRGFESTLEADVLTWCLDPTTHGHVPVWAPSTAATPSHSSDGAASVPHPGENPDGDAGRFDDGSPESRDRRPDGEPDDDPDAARREAERETAQAAAEQACRHQEALERYQVELTRNRTEAAQAATTVRRDWLAGFLRRKNPPKEAVRYVLESLVLWQVDFDDAAAEGHDLACELLGVQQPQVDDVDHRMLSQDLLAAARSASAGRATVLTLALVLAGQERALSHEAWRHHTPAAAPYLRGLERWGYALSPIETLMVDPDDADVAIDGDPTPPADPNDESDSDDTADSPDQADGDPNDETDEDPDSEFV